MISYLEGRVLNAHTVLTTGGVGYAVQTPSPLVAGNEVALFIYTQVRENSITLYGFFSTLEQQLFEALIAVPATGPTAALALLRELPAGELLLAIQSNNAAALARAKGVGIKSAERICAAIKLPKDLHKNQTTRTPVQERLSKALSDLGALPSEINYLLEESHLDFEQDFATLLAHALLLLNADSAPGTN
jgi:Holliday junction DNA helicase RuvA